MIKVRALQEKIFTDKYDLHGLDAFSENCENQLSFYIKKETIDDHISDIILLFEDSKAKNLKRKKVAEALEYSRTGYRKLDKINAELLEIDKSLERIEDFSNPLIKKYYLLNLDKQKLVQELLTAETRYLDIKKINAERSILKSNEQAHLEIIETPKYYWYYFLHDDTFILDSINKEMVNELIPTLKQKILLDKSIDSVLNETKNLFSINIPSNITLSISTDGTFNLLPLSLVFEGRKIFRKIGLLNSEIQNIQITDEDFSVFSLTDLKTNRIKQEGQEYSELLSGFRNCENIKEMMDLPEAQYLVGKKFTKEKILSNFNSKAWHISTHAISTPKSYFDNFFIARNNKGIQEKVYAYDILKIDNPPKFLSFSACNVAVGESKIGAGDFSLSRPFHEIGTSTILSTLWEVDDRSSAKFFDEFFSYWYKNDVSALEAFDFAQSSLKNSHPEPHHWAPYILEGNPNVYLSKNVK